MIRARLGRARAYARRLVTLSQLLRSEVPSAPSGLTLIFAPEAAVRPHLHAQLVLARTLQASGEPVLVTRCFRCFERCPVRDMYARPFVVGTAEDVALCLGCSAYGIETTRRYELATVDLRRYATDEIRERARSLVTGSHDLMSFELDGIPFGRIATYDLSINKKVSEHEGLDRSQRAAWRSYIEAAATYYLTVGAMCRELAPAQLVLFNDYGAHVGARLAAERAGTRVLTLTLAAHRNNDRRLFHLRPAPMCATAVSLERAWPEWRDLALPCERVREIMDDLLSRLKGGGSHQYSPSHAGQDVRATLGLVPGRRTLVAYTSSLDESIGQDFYRELFGVRYGRARAFPDQLAWLRRLVTLVEEESDDLQLVVRIHPREGSTARLPIDSQHLRRLMREFSGSFNHVRFVWPTAPVSSYDLAEVADLALPSWSTIGLEMGRLGVPVLTAFRGVMPFPEEGVIEFAATEDAYLARLREKLESPARLEQIRDVNRWYNLSVLGATIDLGDVVESHAQDALPAFKLSRNAELLRQVVLGRVDPIDVNRGWLAAGQSAGAVIEEERELATQLGRAIHYLLVGEVLSRALEPLEVRLTSSPPAAMPAARSLRVDGRGSEVVYTAGASEVRRDSPLVARLGRMLAQRQASPSTALHGTR